MLGTSGTGWQRIIGLGIDKRDFPSGNLGNSLTNRPRSRPFQQIEYYAMPRLGIGRSEHYPLWAWISIYACQLSKVTRYNSGQSITIEPFKKFG